MFITHTKPQAIPKKTSPRYELLDGVRGLACLVVVLHHLGVWNYGHAAVMVFFVISGYCITGSTQVALLRASTVKQMIFRRLHRIYPPYFFALIFFALTRFIKNTINAQTIWDPSLIQWVQNLTLTQWLSLPFASFSEASQNPALFVTSFWSLNYEEQFYLVMAILMALASAFKLNLKKSVLILAIVGLTWNLTYPVGWISGFFIEYWLHFSMGALLFFTLTDYRYRSSLFILLLVTTALFLAFSFSINVSFWKIIEYRSAQELLIVTIVTWVLFLLRPFSEAISKSIAWKPLAAVGTISYSLYLVHQFNLTLVASITSRLLPTASPEPIKIMTMLALHIGIGAIFWWLFERRFMPQYISKKTVKKSQN